MPNKGIVSKKTDAVDRSSKIMTNIDYWLYVSVTGDLDKCISRDVVKLKA